MGSNFASEHSTYGRDVFRTVSNQIQNSPLTIKKRNKNSKQNEVKRPCQLLELLVFNPSYFPVTVGLHIEQVA